MKQIAAMMSETIGQPAPKLVTIASRMPATPIRPNVAGGQHEAVGALLALLSGEPGSAAALDVAHLSDDATRTPGATALGG